MQADDFRREQGERFAWNLVRRIPSSQLSALGALHPLLAQLLLTRGHQDELQVRSFLQVEGCQLSDAFLMAGLEQAVARLRRAIENDELIAIYGDYDVDGLTATALVWTALRRLGARVLPFIPHRERDGYGLTDGPLSDLRTAGATLAVTVDCGVSAAREIARAHAAGLEVIVTDHHLVPAVLPATAVLNPHRPDCSYPFKELAGVGVAYKLAEGLLRSILSPEEAEAQLGDLLELVAIGTLADQMPLRGENRTMVSRGISRMKETTRPGLCALMAVAGVSPAELNAERIVFAIVPRLDAAGRLDNARLALDLLMSESMEEAQALAEKLNGLNRARQSQTSSAVAAALATVASSKSRAPL